MISIPSRWVFGTAHGRGVRTVTVLARTRDEAVLYAREELDRRAERSGREAPVAWTLWLMEGPDKP